MDPVVVDSNVIVASFLESEAHHDDADHYISGLENGDYIFHLPLLVGVEVTAAISRRALGNRVALLTTWRQNVVDWERDGNIVLYSLNRDRMNRAVELSERLRLRGSDAAIGALAEELGIPLKTFDAEILQRYERASL